MAHVISITEAIYSIDPPRSVGAGQVCTRRVHDIDTTFCILLLPFLQLLSPTLLTSNMCGGEQYPSAHSPLEMDDDDIEVQEHDESPFDSPPTSPDLDGSGSSTPNPIPIRARQSPSFNYHELQKLKAVSVVRTGQELIGLLTGCPHICSKMAFSSPTTGLDTIPPPGPSSPTALCDSQAAFPDR